VGPNENENASFFIQKILKVHNSKQLKLSLKFPA
jgi:hypothetical protein